MAAHELEGSGAAREEWSGRRVNDHGGGGIYSAVNLRWKDGFALDGSVFEFIVLLG